MLCLAILILMLDRRMGVLRSIITWFYGPHISVLVLLISVLLAIVTFVLVARAFVCVLSKTALKLS